MPLVIDADALTALGDAAAARTVLDKRDAPSILTPHDGEYARHRRVRPRGGPPGRGAPAGRVDGCGRPPEGPAHRGGRPGDASSVPDVLLSTAGGPALATAGSGDVLSGIIGAFCARGLGALEAAALAAHVHGRAAALGPSQGLVAGDLPGLLARLLTALAEPAGTIDDDGHGHAGG